MIPVQDDIEFMLITFGAVGILVLGISYVLTFVYNEFRNPKD